MNAGTPAGMQLERAVKAIFPASTSSLSFFIRSFTHGFRFGLLRSAIRKVGWALVPLGTKGCAGSLVTGGRRPGTATKLPAKKLGPSPLIPPPAHPTWFEEKSGGAAFCCATAGAVGAAHARP